MAKHGVEGFNLREAARAVGVSAAAHAASPAKGARGVGRLVAAR